MSVTVRNNEHVAEDMVLLSRNIILCQGGTTEIANTGEIITVMNVSCCPSYLQDLIQYEEI